MLSAISRLASPFRGVLSASVLLCALLAPGMQAIAQAPVPLPENTITVVGGGTTSTGSATTPVACSAGSPYKSYDSYGDGCPGPQATLSTDLRGGVATDGQGNVYIADTSNSVIRKYDPKSTVISRLAGKGTNCTAANGLLDSSGDGCPAQQTSFASTPRGIATDPWGNVLFAGYGTQMIHVVCQATSPLCPGTTGRKLVGSMYRVAGCVATSGSTATAGTAATAGSEGDNSPASPFNNLSGDAQVFGSSAGNGTCSNSVGILNQPRGVAADRFGNVYIAETGTTGGGQRYRVVLGPQTYNNVTNPMWAIVNGITYTPLNGTASATYTAHEGYIYTLLGGFAGTPTAAGGTCGAFTATDSKGDGCPFPYSSANGGEQGVAVDNSGNVIFSDTVNSLVRVLYAGGANAAANPMYPAIVANSPGVTPTAGNVYLLAGGGTASPAGSPALGNTLTLPNQVYKVTVGLNGNLYLGDSSASQVFFYDISTGTLRVLFKTAATVCAAHVAGATNGDGCPANGFTISGTNGFGVAVDPLGNLYAADSTNQLIRKIEAVSLIPTTVGSTTAAGAALTQTILFHGPAGTTSITASVLNNAPDITVGTLACNAANTDTTMDCTVPVTFAPTQPGPRTAQLAVTANGASGALGSKVFAINGAGVGTALTTDVASPTTANLRTNKPVSLTVDGAGNVFSVDNVVQALEELNPSGSPHYLAPTPGMVLTNAVDTAGNIYTTSSGSATLEKYTLSTGGSYNASSLSVAGVALPQAVATDASGNLYVADKTTGSVFEVPAGTAFSTQQTPMMIGSGFTNPVGLAIDGNGIVYVADQGAPGVFRISNVNGVQTTTLYAAASGSPTVTVAGLVPVAIAADAGGNVYVQDSTSKSVILIPAGQTGPASVTVLTGLTTPSGVAVAGNGVVYSADSAVATGVTQVQRNAATFNFGTNTSTVFSGTITNAGNATATGFQTAGQDSADFPVTSVSPTNCFASTAVTPGFACAVTSQFTPTSGTGAVSSTLAYAPAASATGSLVLSGTKNGAAVTTTTTVGAGSPSNPVYAASGTEVTFPVTVTASGGTTPTGSVNVTVDNGTPVAYPLSGGMVSVPLSGLTAGSHTIAAAYPSQAGLTGSSSATVMFSVAQATTMVSWTPAAFTQQFSAAVGTGNLNATASSGGVAVAGAFIYTATPSGGAAQPIHSASYLPIGRYALGVTFVPTDTTDFSGATGSVASYTVTKATTTAAVGATNLLVAADGSGNYTTVQAAVNAVGATGGSVYIKPGTYKGLVTVVQPNVSLRGLGGDPTAVVLTNAQGAFGGTGTYANTGEFSSNNGNGSQLPSGSTLFTGDEGSATLVVAKGTNTALGSSQLTPNGFYGENFTLANTYDTDPVTTTTTYLPTNGSTQCTANAGPAQTYAYLYNNGQLCASQALAIWTTADLQVMNNVYTTSAQDTIYAGSQGSGASGYVPARQYWFRGKVTGNVDYIFGDAAAVFDYSSIYTTQHGTTAGGTETIEAQNKAKQTGGTGDYLSGYVMNSNVFTASNALTQLYFGRPYGTYSTWIMLNSYVDLVNPLGYIEFGTDTNLPTSTYAEYNDLLYTDPATGAADLNGVLYLGQGGNSGSGVTGTRETTSQDPGTPEANNAVKTSLTQAQAQAYFPTNFLSQTVSSAVSNVANWNPTAALAANVNAFVPGGALTVPGGTSVTVLMRPQTPGLGAVNNGVYTVPTGSYTLTDTYNGTTATLASGSLDASGEAYFTSSTLNAGTHNLVWTYGGDSNFSGSTTSSAYQLTVTGATTAIALSAPAVTYGQAANVTVSVTSGSGSTATAATGSVSLSLNGGAAQTMALSNGSAVFSYPGLQAGSYSLAASFAASPTQTAATQTGALAVNKATLTVTASCANRLFDTPDTCTAASSGYQYSDTAATVLATGPSATPATVPDSPAGTYTPTAAATLTTAGAANYTLALVGTPYTISGGVPQQILFAPLPNFTHGGSYQLSARTTSGLPVTYSVTGPATVSGSTLTVSGTGTVTVTAMQTTDPTGDYAAATPVQRSFVAQ